MFLGVALWIELEQPRANSFGRPSWLEAEEVKEARDLLLPMNQMSDQSLETLFDP